MITGAVFLFSTLAKDVTAFTHVTLIDGSGKPPVADQTIVVESNKFVYVGSAANANVPTGATIVNGKGKFVIPGLWDMHTHFDDPEMLELKPTKTEKELQLPLMIANGVTGARDMGGDLALMKNWHDRIQKGKLLGPRLHFVGPLVDGHKPMWPASVAVETPAEGRKAVQELKRQGVDQIKVYSLLSREAFFAIADECKKQNIPFSGHVPARVTNIEAVEAGQKTLEHLLQLDRELADPVKVAELQKSMPAGLSRAAQFKFNREVYEQAYSEERAAAFFALMKKHGTWTTPTLNVVVRNATFNATDPKMVARAAYEPAYLREWWNPEVNVHLKSAVPEINDGQMITLRIYQRILRGMNKAGIPIMVGSDMGGNPHCFAGWGVHDEMALLVESGMSSMDVLIAATSNPARFLGIDKSVGTVAKGKLADMVLLDSNPLEDIRNSQTIRAVVSNGKYFSRAALDALLAKAKLDGAKRIPQKDADDWIESSDPIRFGG
ncbi:MAG TPA: amidohydrolase family protein [Fimbriimonas sp.]|nr:amidohydrolase family protein [Fimbriimonas sp.]